MKYKHTKKGCQEHHARTRARERYGIHLDENRMQETIRRIQAGEAVLIERQSLRLAVYDVEVQEQLCRVVYDRERKTLVTFLYREIPEELKWLYGAR